MGTGVGSGGAAALLYITAGILLFILCKSYADRHKIFEKRRRRKNPSCFMETDILITHGRGLVLFLAAGLLLLIAGGTVQARAAENSARTPVDSGRTAMNSPQAAKGSGSYILMKNAGGRLVLLRENVTHRLDGDVCFLLEGGDSGEETVRYAVREPGGQAVWRRMDREFPVEQDRWRGKGEVLVTVRSDMGGKTNWEKHYRLLFS